MEETRITFETAKLSKEKGFNLSTSYVFEDGKEKFLGGVQRKNFTYENVITRPTQSLLQKWLREVHKIAIDINTHYNTSKNTLSYGVVGFLMKHNHYSGGFSKREFTTYEEALEIGLQEALKLIKNGISKENI